MAIVAGAILALVGVVFGIACIAVLAEKGASKVTDVIAWLFVFGLLGVAPCGVGAYVLRWGIRRIGSASGERR